MSKIIVDTSVWIEYFSTNPKHEKLSDFVDELIDENRVAVNELILTELVPFLKQAGKSKIVELLYNLEIISCTVNWERIIAYQIINLKNGLNGVGIPDLIIIQSAVEKNYGILSLDKHFLIMSELLNYKIIPIKK